MITEGKPAPDFTLLDQDGIQRNLKDFSGKWLLLFFYPKDGTPGWTIEVKAFGESLKQFEKIDAVIFGVSQDSVSSHRRFRDKYRFPVNLLADPEKQMSEDYDSVKKRKSFLIDPQGKLIKTYYKVKPAEHAKEVFEDLIRIQVESKQ